MDEAVNLIQQSVAQNNAWSAEQAQKQMDFQREMSNTAHQREVADLKAAGLNPVLSAKLGGASTPSGAMAQGDTSGTSALIDLLQMAMSTANSAAGAAQAAVESNKNGLTDDWLGSQGFSAYHMSKEDADKVHGMLGDGSTQKAVYDSAASTISGFFGKLFGREAGKGAEALFKSIAPEFDPVKRGEAAVDRINANAVGTKWLVGNMSKVVDALFTSAKSKIAAFNAALNNKLYSGHSHYSGKF